MMTEVSIERVVGRKFKGFWGSYTSGQAILVFDGAFTTLTARLDRDDNVEITAGERLKVEDFGDDALIRAGVISKAEMDAAALERREAWKARNESWERADYERLKKKFEKEK